MTAPELAESPPAARDTAPHPEDRRSMKAAAVIVAGLTVVGFAFRYPVARQSLFADELSTYWISATHGLGGVVSLMYGTGKITHAEITPPLSFLLFWLTSRLGHAPELLRLPSLIAGTASIPVVYLIGRRTVGRPAALVATGLTTLSPFMIYYSAEARAYGLMMLAVLVSTLAILLAVDAGRVRWWVMYGISACAAFYLHYTCVFVLAVQFVWVLWAHPQQRRAVVIASVAAAVGVLPWAPGLINDFRSPTLKILSALSPFTPYDIRLDLEHWTVGYPYTLAGGLSALPGLTALVLLAIAFSLAVGGLLAAARGSSFTARIRSLDRRVVLIIVLALATGVGEALVSATGDHVFGVRNLAASWPYLALIGAAALTLPSPQVALVASTLALAGFAIGAVKMLGGRFDRPDYQGAARYVQDNFRPGDVVVDETGALSPGPLTGLDVSLTRQVPIIRAEAPAERGHPFGFSDRIVPLQEAVNEAVAAAHGHRVFLITNVFTTDIAQLAARINPAPGQFPPRYRLVAERGFSGIGGTLVAVYRDVGSRQ
jgi:hypothetical protein